MPKRGEPYMTTNSAYNQFLTISNYFFTLCKFYLFCFRVIYVAKMG